MKKIITWVGLVLGLIGGAGLVGVGLADAVQVIVVFAALVIIGHDIIEDWTPDLKAVVGAFVLPSLIVGIGGKIPGWIGRQLENLWGWANDTLGAWVGTTTVGLALAAVAISFILAIKGSTGRGAGSMARMGGR